MKFKISYFQELLRCWPDLVVQEVEVEDKYVVLKNIKHLQNISLQNIQVIFV